METWEETLTNKKREFNMLRMVTASGIEHGLLHTLINQVPKSKRFKNVDAKTKEDLEKKIKADSEIVELRFIHYKGGSIAKDYYAAAGEPIYMFTFIHDNVYKVPKGLADQVNDPSRMAEQREGSIDGNGTPIPKDGPKKRLYHFVRDVS